MQSFMMPKGLEIIMRSLLLWTKFWLLPTRYSMKCPVLKNKESVFLYKGGNLKTILCFSFVEIGHLHSKFRPTYQKPYNWSRSWTLSLKGSNVKPLENEMMQENMTTAMDICKKIIKDHPTP
ncbi:unnamed protein product [Lactuca virosa]|uniref:Uncharacterized protein n=1 Tax=Lactuca virosa TaxID=75947 RepID=A0AAU9PD67_9ASTR|nr:unnamed protein product [Lactuca virosa]